MGVMKDADKKKLTKDALKCWYLRWLLAFVLLLAIELLTVIVSNNLLYGLSLKIVKIISLAMPTLFAVAVVVVPYLRYRNFSYKLDNNKLFIFSGFFPKKRETLSIRNIQHIELRAFPFERIYHLATIKIYTAGSEHILPSIELVDAKYLQNLVYRDYRE